MKHKNTPKSGKTDHEPPGRHDRRGQKGFSLVELLAVVNIIGLLASILLPTYLNYIHKAWLSRCMAELKGIQTGVYMVTLPDDTFPSSDDFWGTVYPAAMPGPYHYLVDNDDANNGHGNELDGWDEGNPGGKEPPPGYVDIQWVIICDHDHAHLAKYVYITESGIPTIATEENDPGYQKFYEKGSGKKPGGKPGGGKKK